MPISATGTWTGRRARGAGFTLLELLIVLFIVGLLAGLVVLSSSSGGLERRLQDEASRLASLLELASENSVLTGRELAASFQEGGYAFFFFQGNDWQPLEAGELFRPRQLDAGLELILIVEKTEIDLSERTAQVEPHIIMYSSGDVSPFGLTLGHVQVPARYEIHYEQNHFAVHKADEE
jgi:general secretion pathway protein H